MKKVFLFIVLLNITFIAVSQPVIESGELKSWPPTDTFKRVIIPNTVIKIANYAFQGCKNITEIIIPSSVEEMQGNPFFNCIHLKKITVDSTSSFFSSENGILFDKSKTFLLAFPPRFDTTSYAVSTTIEGIGNFAFQGCSHLNKILIPSSVKEIGVGVFLYCYNLTDIAVDESSPEFISEDGILFDKNKTILIKYPDNKEGNQYFIPNTVKSIAEFAFACTKNLTDISIPNSVKFIKHNAFLNSSLHAIKIPSSVCDIESYAFQNSQNLTSVKLSNEAWPFSMNVFRLCNQLITIDLSDINYSDDFNMNFYVDMSRKVDPKFFHPALTFYVANEKIKNTFKKSNLNAIVGKPLEFIDFYFKKNQSNIEFSITTAPASFQSPMKERGVVVSEKPFPSTNDTKIIAEKDGEIYNITMDTSNMEPKIYYARSYVIYENLTTYSKQVSFTLEQPNNK